MLAKLLEITADPKFPGEGWVRLEGAAWGEGDATLRFAVALGEAEDRRFEVRAHNLRSQRVTVESADHLKFETDHPILLPHRDPQMRLLFRGSVKDPHALLGALLAAHETVASHWLAPNDFLNPELTSPDLLRHGSGLLAVGPRSLLAAYAEVCAGTGLGCTLELARAAEEVPPKALLLGETYWVAEAFEASEV